MQFNKVKNLLIPLFLILITLFTRFVKLDWGNGYYFHPDENNIAFFSNSLQLPIRNWNFFSKGTFSYGSFISYLAFFVNFIREKYFLNIFQIDKFSFIILFIRFLSAVSSSFTVFFVYKICIKFWNYKIALISSILIILSPGLIQAAHFGTFESTLTLLSVIILYFCLKIYKKPTQKDFLIGTFFVAISSVLKINSVLLLIPVFAIYFFNKNNKKNIIQKIILISIASTIYIFTFFLLSPYYLTSSFWSMLNYEQQIVRGTLIVFYTRQFIGSVPFIFTFIKIFPFQTNILLIISFPILLIFSFIKPFKYRNIMLLFTAILFIPNALYFTKWSRYMIPVIPFIILFCTIVIDTNIKKIENIIFTILLFISLCSSFKFINLYLHSDIRVQASEWMLKNIPTDSKVLSESGNVVNLPLKNNSFEVNNFDFYNPENSKNLPAELTKSDYIIIPSRRVFKNNFPEFKNYYQNLFSNNLGFIKIKEFKPQSDLFLNSENAEETWSVFDQPTIRIYKKVNNLTPNDYQELL